MNVFCYVYLRRYSLPQTLASVAAAAIRNPIRFLSHGVVQSWISSPGNPLIKWPSPPPQSLTPLSPPISTSPMEQDSGIHPTSSPDAFKAIADLLADPAIYPGPTLESALDGTGIEPDSDLLVSIFRHFDSSPKLLHSLFLWAEKRPCFSVSPVLFNSVINMLAKSREFESAWSMILDRLSGDEGSEMVSVDTLAILIRRYARVGLTEPAIRTFENSCTLGLRHNLDVETSLFEILLDSLCKEGHVRAASDYFHYRRVSDPSWKPPIRVYNILLNGWFRSRKLKHAENLWAEMKSEDVKPTVVTYGTLVEGYCRMRRAERAMELIHEMRREGIEPNAIVYNPVIDALGEAGRFRELSSMMERFLMCESGPTLSTYNSLVKGFCKAGELVEASKTLRTMISRGFNPTPTTYNYFFRYFSKFGKIDDAMNLYMKMVESGYNPDRLTYHLLLKMLCEAERHELALQISGEMRLRGIDMDLASGTMLVHLLCKMYRFDEAFAEFVDMIRRGIVPQYLTFQRMKDELNKNRRTELARKLCEMMSSLPHSTKLPNTYGGDREAARARRSSIMHKAEAMSDILKTCNNPRKLIKRRGSNENTLIQENSLSRANHLTELNEKKNHDVTRDPIS
ncbi:hypothetical protein SAY86_010922 [Trapa natans]|uniref:Pentatricopeptide repeat-containing protein n=1 Tax=Trapa natans TaxID=22666 RepID=A0AAN7LLB4_TRANT|nr:hypothetical protein SAY86_010922 [Trapa natans]